MLSDMQQNSSSHPSIAPSCSSNSGFDNSIRLNSSSNSCYPPSSSSGASSTYPWGTWEDLLLASAVLRHGMDNWSTVSCELQARAFLVPPSLFSAEACKVRFWILNGRFSSCSSGTVRDGKIPWFEEVRKLRVAQLKRELERYDGSIGLLEKKLNRLKAENAESAAVVSRNAREQDHPSSLAPEETVGCLQVCSTSDRMRAEQSLGTSSRSLLESDFVQISCATASTEQSLGTSSGSLMESKFVQISCATAPTVTREQGDVHKTLSVSDLKESLTVENADQNLSSGGLVFDGSLKNTDQDMHLHSIPDQNALVCVCLDKIYGPSTIEVDHRPHNSQDCLCSTLEDKKSSEKFEDAELESNVALPSSKGNQDQESEALVMSSEDDRTSALGGDKEVCDIGMNELEDGGLALEDACRLCSPPGLVRSVEDDVPCTGGELEVPPWSGCLLDDAGCAKSAECVNVLPSSAGKLADNVVKEVYTVEDSLVSASAMDLLRIAYADGTPVSTPEAVEIQPVEPETTEETEGSEKADCLCLPMIHELGFCEPDLLCCNLVKLPCQRKIGELQSTKQDQTLGIQTNLSRVFSVEEVTPVEIKLVNAASALGLKHSSEQKGFQVAEVSSPSSKAPIASNLGVESIVEKADTGQVQNVGGSPIRPDRTCSAKLEPDNKFLNNAFQEGNLHETQDLRKGAGSDSLECSESFGKECTGNVKAGPYAEMDKVKGEESSGVAFVEDFIQEVKSEAIYMNVNLPAKLENMVISPRKSGSCIVTSGENPALELHKGSQSSTCVIQSLVEPKGVSSSSALQCEKKIMELAQVVSHGCDPNPVHASIHNDKFFLNNMSCHSDGSKSVIEAINQSVCKLQEPDCAMPDSPLCAVEGISKASHAVVQRLGLESKADSKTLDKQVKLEECSKLLVASKSSRDAGPSSPLHKGKHSTDLDMLEEDGLLVDLMKLKDTDLTTLKKRKHLSRGGNNVEKCRNYGLSKDGLGELFVDKHSKLSRCQEEDGNRNLLFTTQNKSPSKLKKLQSSLGDKSDPAKVLSNVSLSDSRLIFGSKELAVEVFPTRRSRFKLRKLESTREEPNKTKGHIAGSVKKFEAMVSTVADEEVSELEISGALSMVNNVETITDIDNNVETITENALPPDLLILLECLRSISGHRFAPLFKIRPEIQSDPRYRGLVKRHMDLITVRTKLEEGRYTESLEFFRDMMLIFSNALVFYSRDSQEFGAARALRESLMREMERFLREESPHRSSAAMQTVKYSESKVLRNLNNSCTVTTCDGKRQASVKSSCDTTICATGFDGKDGVSETTLGLRIASQDYVSGNRTRVRELDLKKKDRGDLVSGKALIKTNIARTKAREFEVDRSNTERLDREKHSRSSEDLSKKRDSVTSSQVLRRSHQASLRTSREYTPRKDLSDKSRSSKYNSERSVSLSQRRQGESESLGGGRSSRGAEQSKQTHSRRIQSYSQPQKRART